MSMDSGQGTPRRAQKCLFAAYSSNSFYGRSLPQVLNKSRDEAFSGDESDLGPMSPLNLVDQSPSVDGSSSGREFISPFATPEKQPTSHHAPMSWDRLTSRRNAEERMSPFSSLKRVTRAARYSPRCRLFNGNSPKSLPCSPRKSAELSTLFRDAKTADMDEIVPETPPRSFATEIQNHDITETPRKDRSPRQRTPLRSIAKTAPLPRLHRRKSFSAYETSLSPEITKENGLKRRAHDQPTIKPAKLFKVDDGTSAPRARAALFQEHGNDGALKGFSLSTKKFYSSHARTERPFAFDNFRNSEMKKRRSLPSYSGGRHSLTRKQRLGRINAGVSHGIKKPKPKVNTEALKKEGQRMATSDKSPAADNVQPARANAERAVSPEIDESKRFFKTIRPSHGATVTVNNKIKLKVEDGKLLLDQKRLPGAHKQKPKAPNVPLDATDLTVDEPEVESTLEKNKVDDLLKMLEDDWANDEYDTMELLKNSASISPLKPVAILPTDAIMSPATELSNMTSTMNIKDVASLPNVGDLSLDNAENSSVAAVAGEEEEESERRYFPLFTKGYSAPENIFEETSSGKHSKAARKSTQWQLSAKVAQNQYQLDAGQKHFGATQCPECNVVYELGDPEDENAHLNFHNSVRVLKFQGWKSERVIAEDPFTSSRVILIEPHDPKQHWKKVSEILDVVDKDLGLADMSLSEYQDKKVLLYVRDKSVVGVLVAESIESAYRMIPELMELNCCTAESTPTKCGINVVWTAMSHRKQGIATKLVDTLRARYFFGYVMSLDDIAFSMPTPSGKIFAEKYTKTRSFKVYH